MKKNPQVKKMKNFPDSELIRILENWKSHHINSVKAALILAEERGLGLEDYRNKISFSESKEEVAWYQKKIFGRTLVWGLAILQILSAIFGLWLINDPINVLFLLYILMVSLSFAAGILIIIKRHIGLILSGINFALQIFIVQLEGIYGLKYFTGLRLGFGFTDELIIVFADSGMSLIFGEFDITTKNLFGVNLFAVLVLVLIINQWKSSILRK